MSIQLVAPNTSVTDGVGWCLRFTQSVWGAPAKYESAWYAWTATQYKHGTNENIPNDVAVVVWFSHYGTYGNPPRSDNWGHVVSWIPGQGFLSSPQSGIGQAWYATIQEVERAFNSTYVGWSEDINGLRVAEITQPEPTRTEGQETDMVIIFHKDRGRSYAIAPQYLHSFEHNNYAAVVAEAINPKGKVINVENANATTTCFTQAYGIPTNVWNGLQPNDTWSANA